jgi:flagellar biosynthetic protein FliP
MSLVNSANHSLTGVGNLAAGCHASFCRNPSPKAAFSSFHTKLGHFLFLAVVLAAACFLPESSQAAQDLVMPSLQLTLSGGSPEPQGVALALEILFLLTVLSLAPAIVLTVTSFTRIIVVFHFIRQALGVQQLPPNQVMLSLAIFMTIAIMMPVGKEINENALQPYLEERMDFNEALANAEKPLREFMFRHTRERDLSIFYSITRMDRPATRDDVPTLSLAAAFVISELKTGFTIGFLIYIPFLILDMVVASTLLAMGMMMLPPMMVSMPFKLLLFVMVDGWTLLVGSLVNSFAM